MTLKEEFTLKSFNVKESLVTDKQLAKPKRITNLSFGLFGGAEIVRAGEIQVCSQRLYELDHNRTPVRNGCLDPRLGVSDKVSECQTCGKRLADCTGHFGYIKLELPVFHIGFFKAILDILQCICKSCSRVLLGEDDRRKYLRMITNKTIDSVSKQAIFKKIQERCKKIRVCYYCGSMNGQVRKVPNAQTLKLVHEKYKVKEHVNSAEAVEERQAKFKEALAHNADLANYIDRAPDPLNPRIVLDLLKRISLDDMPLLWLDAVHSKPESMILTHLLVPPVAIRPSVKMDVGAGSNEDDLTMKMREIINVNNALRDALAAGGKVAMIAEAWDFLQVQVGQYINGELPGLPPIMRKEKPIRGLVQRLKGKQGRFRGNLSGKRVDFSARTVISPDPNLSIHQVGVPMQMAKRLTYPEVVNDTNIQRLRKMVIRGPYKHPGANYIRLKGESTDARLLPPLPQQHNAMVKTLAFGDRRKLADELEVGDVVERHIIDDDVVLFNRQPSLHKMSIMCHRAKVLHGRTLRFNECVCSPYNADFDGDEMNLHVPQTEEARAEAVSLMGVQHNLITPRNGEPIVTATQDFITSSFLMTQRDVFLDKQEFCQLVSTINDCNEHIELPPPVVLKPKRLWTGKQVWTVLLRPNNDPKWPLVNLETKERNYSGNDADGCCMCPYEGYVVFRNSELLCGNLGKGVLGGSKSGLIYVLIRDHSEELAAKLMNRMTKVVTRWLSEYGFTIGIDDVTPSETLLKRKEQAIQKGYSECQVNIRKFEAGTLTARPGCNLIESLESEVSGILSNVRDISGKMCMQTLPRYNKPFIMATCGSKGSALNICQMIACVGQQIVGGKRMPDGFMRRSLPHFPLDAKDPAAKGFVANSFYSGLTAPEFFFHTMGGREGLVDTAVKTAETGYMARRLMKALEDLSVRYDGSVRNSVGGVVQFTYGDDSLNPAFMEKGDKPVDWQRLLSNVLATIPCKEEKALTGIAIRRFVDDNITSPAAVLSLAELSPNSANDAGMPYFVAAMRHFLNNLAQRHETLCSKVGITLEANQRYMKLSRKLEIDAFLRWIDEDTWKEAASEVGSKAYEECAYLLMNNLFRLTRTQLLEVVRRAVKIFQRAIIEPGEAVGAIGAQSLGEPGTQMTLKTFHFAGVASMNVTLGVPRIKEIINASKAISTPIITVRLEKNDDERVARIVQGRIESTTLGEVTTFIEEEYSPHQVAIIIQLDSAAIDQLNLEITPASVVQSICASRALKLSKSNVQAVHHKDQVHVFVPIASAAKPRPKSRSKAGPIQALSADAPLSLSSNSSKVVEQNTMFLDTQRIKGLLCLVRVAGIDTVHRAVVNIDEDSETGSGDGSKKRTYHLLVEGSGLLDVLGTAGVDGTKSTTNHIMELEKVLGIEAARQAVMDEVAYIFGRYGLSIDRRHLMLLADVMSYRGMILGITRFGISKMKESVLMLASFEKTADHLFDAAVHARTDEINGVSECIIMGTPIPIGTGMFKILSDWRDTSVKCAKASTFLQS